MTKQHRLEQPFAHPAVPPEPERSPKRASNDPHFGEVVQPRDIDQFSETELFQKRRAHEIAQKLGFRDPQIDAAEIAYVQQEMQRRGLGEAAFHAFLSERKTENQ